MRKPYPSDVSVAERPFVASCLTLVMPDAWQQRYVLRGAVFQAGGHCASLYGLRLCTQNTRLLIEMASGALLTGARS